MTPEARQERLQVEALLAASTPSATSDKRNKAPPRVQFFAWLLVRERIQSCAHLHRRKVLDNATCEVCSEADETAAHIMFGYPFAVSFWSALNITMPEETTTAQLCELAPASHVPLAYYSTFLLLCCWQPWKRRNWS
ncbi:hypothetical protein C2845_PM09G11040 [Panicum miliaceum]|uniref:Reverse transcriptase zinc-binding domain-containing protein n=1 Tax=Panicum miliaceum TaxID=4540 RepID=A0A3L6S0T4_PANMI|nr:hypothetical protein C2845_PM09G11040 [Panicum miliaceum]